MKHCLILAALLFIAPYAAAQKTVSTSYNLERETYRDVQEKIENYKGSKPNGTKLRLFNMPDNWLKKG
jgi:hypothetical protein